MTTTRPTRPTPRSPGSRPSESAPAVGETRTGNAVVAVKRLFAAETSEYFWLLGTTLFMVAIGLVMVLSSSSIESFRDSLPEERSQADFFTRFTRQGLFVILGIPVMLILSRIPPAFWKKFGWQALIGAMVLQLLVFVPGLGWGTGGNQNWIRVGGLSMQPSEFVKVALVVWLALILTTKASRLHDWKHVFIPVAPVGGLAIGLVLAGKDLGTAAIMLMILLGALFFAGVRLRIVGMAALAVGVVGALFLFASDGNRRERIDAWMSGCAGDEQYSRYCWQTVHGWWALADGGPFGVGLGNSTAKWSWLPAASDDFIFAIIGEELGLIGALVVLLLFVMLAISLVRVARMVRDPFGKIIAITVMVWIIGQAFVNIAVVLGILPVLGVPLPLMSAGGSALIANLGAIGIVLSFARTRHEPEFSVR